MTLTRKQLQKLKKEVYNKINAEVKEYESVIAATSPFHSFFAGEEDINTAFNQFSRSMRLQMVNVDKEKTARNFHKRFVDELTQVIKYDKASEYGLDVLDDKNDEIDSLSNGMKLLDTQYQYEYLLRVESINLLSKLSFTKLKHLAYYENDDLKSDIGRKLTELCFKDVDYQTLLDRIDEEVSYCNNRIDNPNILEHFIQEDTNNLIELLKKEEPFYVYRGFLINEDEYVRAGKKVDGADYYKQDAGKGVSYSLREEYAYFFCYLGLTYNSDGTIIDPDTENPIRYIPHELRTKEEWISYQQDIISQRIDKRKMKPIVCKFLIDPNQLKGFNMRKSEAEVNVLTEDIIVERYTIASSQQIAENLYKTEEQRQKSVDGEFNYDEDKVVVFAYTEKGRKYYIYANGTAVNKKLKVAKEQVKNAKLSAQGLLDAAKRAFMDASIELPDGVDAKVASKRWWDFMKSKPENILRRKNHSYLA